MSNADLGVPVADLSADNTDLSAAPADLSQPPADLLPPTPKLCSPDGWCWEDPLPQGNILYGIWGKDASNVWAVGAGGTIIKWNGTSWTTQISGTVQDLHGVWGTDASNVWAVGQGGTIVKWDRASARNC